MSIRVAFPAATARTADSRLLSPIDPREVVGRAGREDREGRVRAEQAVGGQARPCRRRRYTRPRRLRRSPRGARVPPDRRPMSDSDDLVLDAGRAQELIDLPDDLAGLAVAGGRVGDDDHRAGATMSPPATTRRRAPTAAGPGGGCPRRRRCCRTSSSPAGSATDRSRPPATPVPRGRPPRPGDRSRRRSGSRRPRAIAGRWRSRRVPR